MTPDPRAQSGPLPEPVPLRAALRLIVITDTIQAGSRGVVPTVQAALEGGARGIQLRMKGASAKEMEELGRELRRISRAYGARLFVNDRADVAAAISADGIHVGPNDPPVRTLRRAFPDLWIGASTDDPDRARALEAEGADYLGCGAVFGTTSKDVGGEAIGLERLRQVVRAVSIPVVGIGGITAENSSPIPDTGAAGVAVIGAIMAAADPRAATIQLLAPWQTS